MGINQQELRYDETMKRRVLGAYLVNGRLSEIPAKLKKRMVILDYLAQQFEVGRSYTEREVSDILEQFHPDYCTLRRELVVMGQMSRKNGIYCREVEFPPEE